MTTYVAESSSTIASALRFLWLEITGKCNLRCSHCYADSGPDKSARGDMQREDWIGVIAEAADLGCRDLQFIGGEPTMHPDLLAMIAMAREQGFARVEVFSNVTRLGSDLLQCFREFQVEVASSFYSDDPKTHDRITGAAGSWQRTIDGLRDVLDAGLRLRVGIIEMEANAGQVSRTANFLRSLGVQRIGSDRLRGIGRGSSQYSVRPQNEFEELCGQCWKGRLCVTSTGSAYPCVFSRAFPMGDARRGLRAILDSERLAGFRSRLRSATELNDERTCRPGYCKPDGDLCRPETEMCEPELGCNPNVPDPD